MERLDLELLESLLPTNPRLQSLSKQHAELEEKIDRMNIYAAYSPTAEIEVHALKKRKLLINDERLKIIASHKRDHEVTIERLS